MSIRYWLLGGTLAGALAVLIGPSLHGQIVSSGRTTEGLSDVGTFNLNTSGTIATSNTTASTSSTTGALKSGGGLGVAGSVYSGGIIYATSSGTPAAAAATISIGGAVGPTLAANGEGAVWQQSANGLLLNGRGSSNDLCILNRGNGLVVCNPASTSNLVFSGIIVSAGYGVASLPTGVTGGFTHVTDQVTGCPAKGATFTAGGAFKCPAFYNGTAWISP